MSNQISSQAEASGPSLILRPAPPSTGTALPQAGSDLASSVFLGPKNQSLSLSTGGQVIHTSINRLPPPIQLDPASRAQQSSSKPIKIGFILNTFAFGGSETETIELIYGADTRVLQFTGIAVARPLPLPAEEPPRNGSFPPIYTCANPYIDRNDPRVKIVADLGDAVRIVIRNADIVMTWGLANLQDYLPESRLPKIIVLSKDSGEWAKSFLYPNSLVTRCYVGNSTLAASAFPEPIRDQVRVIHDGINLRRVVPRIGWEEQRAQWDLTKEDKIAGYLGRIERDKGVDKVVEGVAQLPTEWKAVFIGVNPNSRYANYLAQHCERAIPGRYRLLGWCHDVGSALAAFDVFCHPSDHEGFSNSIGEAWLAGIPTIYTQNTGAIPDVGDLGIGVSPDADGAEIAAALLKAYGNQELISRARRVIESNFPIERNVQHWTDYLLEVHRQHEKPRIMLLFPADIMNAVTSWLPVFAKKECRFDLCCVILEANSGNTDTLSEAEIYKTYKCPAFRIGTSGDVEKLLQYTRPNAILTFEAPTLRQLLPTQLSVPALIASIDQHRGEANWISWLHYLMHVEQKNVYK